MKLGSQLRLSLFLILSIALSLILAFGLRGLYYFRVGPLFSLAFFLLLPMSLTIVLGEWWTLTLTPFLFWSIAWATLYLLDRLIFSDEQQLIATTVFFSVASVSSGALGILLRKCVSYLKRRWRPRS